MTSSFTFEDYCEDHLDQDPALMNSEQYKDAKAGYADLISSSNHQKSPAEIAKNEKALAKAKESRKLAKFYGGRALTGSAAQKKWAEDIRQNVLESSSLSDDQKVDLVTLSGVTNTAAFWIDNKDKNASAFNPKLMLADNEKLNELYSKHFVTLARSGSVHAKELAKKEIYETLRSLTVNVKFEFPNCNFYDVYGKLKSGLKFRC